MSAHTPGPWVVDWQGPDQPIYAGNVCVATAWAGAGSGLDDETKDNASLIAAAPTLLDALRYLVARVDAMRLPDGSTPDTLGAHVAISLAEHGCWPPGAESWREVSREDEDTD